jgi:predicted nuclease of predicted toxin-antitoxin system
LNFKIDENLPIEFVEILKSSGYEAMTVFEQGLNGKVDSEVINKCQEENFILLTLDLDFADINLYPPYKYPGIIAIRAKYQYKWYLLDILKSIIPNFKHEKIKGKLWIVEENKIRIRDN